MLLNVHDAKRDSQMILEVLLWVMKWWLNRMFLALLLSATAEDAMFEKQHFCKEGV